jgi:hypothetical protein
MGRRVSVEEAHAWLAEHMMQRPDIGLRKAIVNVMCYLRSPFISKERRKPRKEFLLAAGLFVVFVAWFVYFSTAS